MRCRRAPARRAPLVAVLVLLVAGYGQVGCGRWHVRPPEPTATSRSTSPRTTLQRLSAGDRLTTSAATVLVLGPRSFTVHDADLPVDGLLVLGEPPAGLRPTQVVIVVGTIAMFRYGEFAHRYQLGDPVRYRRYEGRKVLLADSVRKPG